MPDYIKPKMASQQNTTKKQEPNEWDKYLAQARMAMMMDGQTALGLALGRLIRGAWDRGDAAAKQSKLDEYNNQQGLTGNGALTPEDIQGFRQANRMDPSFAQAPEPTTSPRTVGDGVADAISSVYNAGMDTARDRVNGTLQDYISRVSPDNIVDGLLFLGGLRR